MSCEELEPRILEYLDGALPAAEGARLEAHLADCASCQAFAARLGELDVTLSRAINAPDLSRDFRASLERRLKARRGPLAEPERAERKRALQAEFEAQVAGLEGRSRWALSLLDALGYVAATVLTYVAVSNFLPAAQAPAAGWHLVFSCLAGGACLVVGLGIAFREHLRRLGLGF